MTAVIMEQTVVDLLPHRPEICIAIPAFFDKAACEELNDLVHKQGFRSADSDYPRNYRNNDRLVMGDKEMAAATFSRLKPFLPREIMENGVKWKPCGVNERFRFCQYGPGTEFTRHRDGVWHPTPKRKTILTFLLYLNSGNSFRGGRTSFWDERKGGALLKTVVPEQGTALVFQHDIWHSGDPVIEGCKLILRSDVIFEADELTPNEQHQGYVWSLCPLRDGGFASGGRDKTIRIHDGEGRVKAVLTGHEKSVLDVKELPCGSLVSCSRDRTLRIWLSQQNHATWIAHSAAVLCIATCGSAIISGSADGSVIHWDASGKKMHACHLGHGWIWDIESLGDHAYVLGCEDGVIQVHDLDGHVLASDKADAAILSLFVSGDTIFAGCENGQIRSWQWRHGHLRTRWRFDAHDGPVTCLAAKGPFLASGSEDEKTRVWNLNDQKLVHEKKHSDFVRALLFPSEVQLLIAAYDGICSTSLKEQAEGMEMPMHLID